MLSDLSGSVVAALLDDDETRGSDDAFADALRRYQSEGAPDVTASWRRVASTADLGTERAEEILRRLTRDLLAGVAAERSAETAEDAPTTPIEAPPPNVRAITEAREVPSLELSSDGSWRPSDVGVSGEHQLDASARRRANVPALVSRYPTIHRTASGGFVIPPTPSRFTQTTTARAPAPTRSDEPAREVPAPRSDGPAMAQMTATHRSAPEPVTSAPRESVIRESVIKAVAAGTEVVAGPFARFQQLALFVKALRGVAGVQEVQTRQFVRGTVHLRVRHSQAVDLAARIAELVDFHPAIVSSTSDRIELTVDLPDDAPPARA